MADFHAKKIDIIEKSLKSDIKLGLSTKEAKKRLADLGPNKLPEEKPLSWLLIIWSQFKNPLVYILFIAASISLLLFEYIDFGIIIAALFLNVSIGFFQEYKADRTMHKLKKLIQFSASVKRSGARFKINSEDLVSGDIIYLTAGDKVPADCRIIEANDLRSVEAALTGESVSSHKNNKKLNKNVPLADRENMVYMGTQIAKGKGVALVCSTGIETEIGKIAKLVKETKEDPTPLQKKFGRLSRTIGIVIAVLTAIIFLIGLVRGHTLFEMTLTSVALAVAAIPEGLPAAVAIALAVAMQKIFKRKGLVKKLVAAETLGSTSVICTDKTGTLTKGEMAVSEIITCEKKEKEARLLALKIGLLNNNAIIENPEDELKDWKISGDSTEKALLLAATQAGLRKKRLTKIEKRLDEIPFTEERKYMATLHTLRNNKHRIYLKGAPEKVLSISNKYLNNGSENKIDSKFKKKIKLQLNGLTKKGLRVLAVGYKETKEKKLNKKDLKDFILVGFIALKDPLRPEAAETIKLCQDAGIKTIIVTGDHKLTAMTIALELGMTVQKDEVLEGIDLDKISDKELKRKIKKIKIFARIEPKHKTRIIDAWQDREQVVAMVGDGVNDAPAIKSADVGVAVGSGTDVAKETSDIIIMDNNLATLVSAVREGRIAFENIKKVTLYLLADAFSEVLLIGGALLLGLPLPILAAQILWVNLVEDGLPDIALAFEPGEKKVMKEKPRKITDAILDTEMKTLIFAIGVIDDVILLALYWWLYKQGSLDIEHIRTIVFVALSIDSLFYVYSCRSMRFTVFQKGIFTNKFLFIAVIIGFMFMFAGVYFPPFQTILRTVPLTLNQWILPFALGVFEILLIELVKYVFIIKRRNKKHLINN